MIPLEERIDLLHRLGQYITENTEEWQEAKILALQRNAWFDEESVAIAVEGILQEFLQPTLLTAWAAQYPRPAGSKKVGIVMAGNIPLVGFHDFLCGFIMGHNLQIKLSSKDDILLKHLAGKLIEWQPLLAADINFADNLKGCDAYIATGSNNTARYFEQYFGKYPNIIRKNRTSVAILDGTETTAELELLGKDIFAYYGLGCRNVTKIYLPVGYDIPQLFDAIAPYHNVINHNKYKNNYDYYLAIYLLNRVPYLTNDFLLMVENKEPFSAVSVLHYEFYDDYATLEQSLQNNDNIQCVVGKGHIEPGQAQKPALAHYADGVDTMLFLSNL